MELEKITDDNTDDMYERLCMQRFIVLVDYQIYLISPTKPLAKPLLSQAEPQLPTSHTLI